MAKNIEDIRRDEIAQYFGFTNRLFYDAVREVPRSYDFTGESIDTDYEDDGWRIADHPSIDEMIENLADLDLPRSDGDSVLTVESPDEDGELHIYVTVPLDDMDEDSRKSLLMIVNEQLAISGLASWDEDDLDDGVIISKTDQGWTNVIRMFGMSEEDFDPDDDWSPVMDFIYPLPRGSMVDEWHHAMVGMTMVMIDGETYLALASGGMDMSWEICETYLRCGYWPPEHFARQLPSIAGRGSSELDRYILDACAVSLRHVISGAFDGLDRLDRIEDEAVSRARKLEKSGG